MDTGSNSTIHYEPNIDAIQELKVLTSNYQAEFGRNSGGTITVVTKSGTQQFHGTAAWNHRHEGFNANSWANNRNGRNATRSGSFADRTKYRFNVETYSHRRPDLHPEGVQHRKEEALLLLVAGIHRPVRSAAERRTSTRPPRWSAAATSRRAARTTASLITHHRPHHRRAVPGQQHPDKPASIPPASRCSITSRLPNFVGTGTQANVVNYFEAASATHPRRNDVLRVDTYLTSKLTGYFRYINDHDNMSRSTRASSSRTRTGSILDAKGIKSLPPVDHPNPGHGYSASATYQISPTTINEFTVGKSWNTWSYYSLDDYASIDRSLVNNPPTLFPLPKTNPEASRRPTAIRT